MSITIYSEPVPGDEGNYKREVKFDKTTGGYIGISQTKDDGLERILLSPKQVKALIKMAGVRVPRTIRNKRVML